jgi:hypothetical protein
VVVQEAGERLGLSLSVELQVEQQVLRVVDRLADGEAADPGLRAGLLEAVECLLPGVVVVDRVLDAKRGRDLSLGCRCRFSPLTLGGRPRDFIPDFWGSQK